MASTLPGVFRALVIGGFAAAIIGSFLVRWGLSRHAGLAVGMAYERALRNFMETFPLFAAGVLVASVIERHSWMTVWGARLYFWGRLAYVPLYATGVPLVRSMIWSVAAIGTSLSWSVCCKISHT